jgi:hypothetical protein
MKPALRVAMLATALALTWQAFTVHYNYQGNWTALFCTGSERPIPPQPEFRGTYIFPNSTGYDGQFYRYVAHDPFFARGLWRWLDVPRLRTTRILVPVLAYAAALGMPNAIDTAYFAVTLAFLFLGVFWASSYCQDAGYPSLWGLAFLLVPSVLVSLDRMTVDLAAASLCCAWARTWGKEKTVTGGGYLLLAALPLTRETAAFLSLGSAAGLFRKRDFRGLAIWCGALIPCVAWYAFVGLHTKSASGPAWSGSWPLAGWVQRVLNPVEYPAHIPFRSIIVALDYVALAGMLLAAVFAILLWLRRRHGTVEIVLVLFAVLVLQSGWTEVWTDAFAFGRVFSPLLLLLALKAAESRRFWLALPLLLVTLRIGAQFGTQVMGILHLV